MSSIGSPSPFFLAGKKAYEVDRSLRFNSGDNTYLARTPSSTTSRTTWTYSTWIKKTSFGSTVGLFLSIIFKKQKASFKKVKTQWEIEEELGIESDNLDGLWEIDDEE